MLLRPKQLKMYDRWLIIALSVVVLIIFVSPHVKAVRLQTKAGQVIADYVATVEQNREQTVSGTFFCLFPTLYPEPLAENDLDQAIAWLNEAKSLSPGNTHSSFLLGQAYCLKGDYSQAIDELKDFVQKRSGNTLAVAELGFAKLSAYSSHSDNEQADRELEKAKQVLEQSGINVAFFTTTGEKSYKLGKYHDALVWFRLGEKFIPLNKSNGIKLALLEAFLEGINDISSDLHIMSMSNDSDEMIIEPASFFQINDGKPASVTNIEGNAAAVIYSNSNAIGVIIDVMEASDYCLVISAIDQKPEPTLLAVSLNYKKISELELKVGDGQIVNFTLKVELEKGTSLISIQLLNDYYIPGVADRNGYITSVRLGLCRGD